MCDFSLEGLWLGRAVLHTRHTQARGITMLRIYATHAVEWEQDGIILRASEVLDIEPAKGNGCVECNRPED